MRYIIVRPMEKKKNNATQNECITEYTGQAKGKNISKHVEGGLSIIYYLNTYFAWQDLAKFLSIIYTAYTV